METDQQEAQQHQDTEKHKSPTYIIKEWAPVCEEELKPTEGLKFDNLDECERFYKNYAHHVGFSVRNSSCKNDIEGVESSKQGFRRTLVEVNSNRKIKLTREGCHVMVAFKRTKDSNTNSIKVIHIYLRLLLSTIY